MRRRCLVLGTLLVLVGAAPANAASPGPSGAPEYWFDTWHVSRLWRDGVRGQGVTIAEIDSGVNAQLPQLRGRVLSGRDFGQGGNGQVDRDIDPFGHGTAMASIMVARPDALGIAGLAPDAKILPIAVPLRGTTDEADRGEIPAAIRWAAAHGADIINLSIGGKRYPTQSADPCPPSEQQAVFYALSRGALVIAAVGNTGPRANTVEEPGVCLGVVSVGAVNQADRVARFSARQPYLSLVAPGVDVPSLGRIPGQAFSGNGTSQAAALTSAAAALVWSRYPQLSGAQVVARLLATVDDRRARPSPAYGYGVLDAYRAVTASVPASAPNPVYALAASFRARVAALGRGLGPAPRPAPTRRVPRGPVRVDEFAPAVASGNGLLPVGVGLAVAGAVALLLLLAYGWRRRSRGRHRPVL
jgi:subtilisin family serine protease